MMKLYFGRITLGVNSLERNKTRIQLEMLLTGGNRNEKK